MALGVRINVGKLRVSAPIWSSEPGFLAGMRGQFKELEKIIGDTITQIEAATPEALLEALRPTQALAITYTPIKTGALRASAFLNITSAGRQPRVEIGFAKGGDPWYALYVHENTQIPHKPPTRSKFLQAAVLEDMANIETRLIQSLSLGSK